MLSDSDIISRAALINPLHLDNLHNCAYTLTVGSIFRPESGAEEISPTLPNGPNHKVWIIGPTESLVVKTKEQLKIPADLCAYYAPLNRLAQKGLMLLNASVVEPGYEGYLSCFLVNFSSQDVAIYPGQEIAKITFHKLDSGITTFRPLALTGAKYDRDLALSARNFSKTFLGVAQIEEKAKEAASKSVKGQLILAGVILFLLISYQQLEPFVSKYLWQSWGVVTTSKRIEANNLQTQLEIDEKRLSELNEKTKYMQSMADMNAKIEQIQSQMRKLAHQRR